MKIGLMKSKKKVTYVKKGFVMIKMKKRNLNYTKNLGDHCRYTGKFRGASHSICDLRYKVPQEIPVKIHNGSKYDYHFLIKELAEEFKGQFECLGENTEKYITFSVPTKDDNGKTITYKIKFIDTCRFMPSKLSDLLITCLKLIKIAKHSWREKRSDQNVILLDLKVID